MIICACDPDTRTPAFAFFDGMKLIGWKLLEGRITELLPEVRSIVETWSPKLLIIENQYLPATGNAANRFRSVSQLVAARAMIMAVFILSGIDWRLADPFAWQRTLGGSSLGREQLKILSMKKASDIAGKPIENHNIADAINLGYWCVADERVRNLRAKR